MFSVQIGKSMTLFYKSLGRGVQYDRISIETQELLQVASKMTIGNDSCLSHQPH
jgi:hypothetical protein